MAIDTATFKKRALTALLFVAIMLTGLLWNQWSFFILFSIIHFGCWKEFQQIIGNIDPEYDKISVFQKHGIRIAGWSFLMFCTSDTFHMGPIPLHALGLWLGITFLFVLPLIELLFARSLRLKNIFYSVAGFIYISIPAGLCMDLYDPGTFPADGIAVNIPQGYTVILIIFAIWINDTMAYIVGSMIGKTPLSKISPKKTWEGTIGGIVLGTTVLSIVFYAFSGMKQLLVPAMALLAIATISGTLGDLLESKLKRLAGIKDSGSFMPGHGGFLDRFDSLLIAIPVCWIFIRLYQTVFAS